MTKMTLTYGIIIGAVVITVAIVMVNLSAGETNHLAGMEWLGYLVQIIAFSIIFVAIKRYRDQDLGGVIKFGKAFKVGLMISIYAAVIYVAAWEVNLNVSEYNFIESYASSVIEDAKASGLSGEELNNLIEKMEAMKANYANTFIRLLITLSEILPTGIVISLISAAILRKSEVLPATETVTE